MSRDLARTWCRGLAVGALVIVAVACSTDPEPNEEAFCEQLESLADLDEILAAEPTALDRHLDELTRLAAVAPAEVQGASEVLVASLSELAVAISGAEDADAALEEALRSMAPRRAEVERASAEVTDYASRVCDIRLG